MKKRILCIFLSALLIFSLLPTAARADASSNSRLPDGTIARLKAKFPAGKYWNHDPEAPNNPDGYTDTPCVHVGSCSYLGSCGCNSFDRSIQCMGFAYKLAYDAFGHSARNWKEVSADNYENDVKAGDIARIVMSSPGGHSIFITAVEGDTITYADANYDHACGIRWGATMSRERFNDRLVYIRKSPEISAPGTPKIYYKSEYTQYDTVTVSWSAENMIDYYMVSLDCNGVQVDARETVYNSYTFKAEAVGQYTVFLTAVNPKGTSETVAARITVNAHDCPAKQYIDVPNFDDWSHAGVEYAVSNGLFNGMSATEFSPNSPMTRGMIATVLWRNAGSPKVTGNNPYPDVLDNFWYTDAIIWATETGMMNGMGEGLFVPDGVLTREQIVTVLYRYAAQCGMDTSARASLSGFVDGSYVSAWALEAMQWAVATGVINGIVDGSVVYISGNSGATRAQVATILMRYLRDVLPGLQ